jgi:hypothetical protein
VWKAAVTRGLGPVGVGWSDKICVIGVSNGAYGRVCNRNCLKRAFQHQCEEKGPNEVPLAYPAGRDNVNGA